MKLIPVKYHNKDYPSNILPQLIEVAGNLDSKELHIKQRYSLHTEYSYMKREFNSNLLDGLKELKTAHKNNIPQLWKSIGWAKEFAVFIERLIGDSIAPEVIEIHPPFKDCCQTFDDFWERYIFFYNDIKIKFPNTKILIENRCGTMYTGSSFLISTCRDVLSFCDFLKSKNKELGIIIDYPQLYSSEKIKMDNVKNDKIIDFNNELKEFISFIGAIHLWGKRRSNSSNRWSPHSGDLNTFFSNDVNKKSSFLNSILNTFDDDSSRYFVPEVNTTEEDLQSIIKDLVDAGFKFEQEKMKDYLIAIEYDDTEPFFILYDMSYKQIKKERAVGKFKWNVGPQKYCIGNRDYINHIFLGCPECSTVNNQEKKCIMCEQNDIFKYCIRCTGKTCYAKNTIILERCNQEHFVYLAFFPDDIIKVGVAHGHRKYNRLYEQGALFSWIIARCKTGKIARYFEQFIKGLGVKDKVNNKKKIENIKYFKDSVAISHLQEVYKRIFDKFDALELDGVDLLPSPEPVVASKTLLKLKNLSLGKTSQLTIWDYFTTLPNDQKQIEIIEELPYFDGEIIAFIGTIAILKQNENYFVFDFQKYFGREISMSSKN